MITERLSELWTVVLYLLLPFRLLSSAILYVLSWLLAPLLLLGRVSAHISTVFFRFLAHFEVRDQKDHQCHMHKLLIQ
jgi:hypothetical protein